MAKKRNRANRPQQAAAAKPSQHADAAKQPDQKQQQQLQQLPQVRRQNPHQRKYGARPLPEARATKGVPREPVFWFGFEIPWAKLVVARVVVFGLLAIDALLQIRHAPRYGANDFNVGQLPLLDGLGVGRVAYGVGQLVVAYLLVLTALGVATRWILPVAAALYAGLYFGSQLDSYQHHYLVALFLVIASCVPWQRPANAEPATPIRSWAVRLLLVQLAIMYLWAAISKLDPAWVDGRTLRNQIGGSLETLIESTVGFQVVSIAVIAVELALAATVWMRRSWFIAAPLGILFHAGIVTTGLEIGVFAYLMVAMYILVIPDRIWVLLAGTGPARAVQTWVRGVAARPSRIAIGVALVVGIGLALLTRLPDALVVALAASVIPLVMLIRALLRGSAPVTAIAVAHVAAISLWLVVDRTSMVAFDYYKYWGGSQRRLDHKPNAERAYRGLIDIAPDEALGHYQLGRILLAKGETEEALARLHDAQRLDPSHARAWIAEARWLAARGELPKAVAKAKDAVFAEPSNQEARALLDSLSSARPVPKPGPDDSEP